MQINGHLRLHLQVLYMDVRRVVLLRTQHADMRPATLQQIDHIFIFRNHALELNIRVTAGKTLQQQCMVVGLPEVGDSQPQTGFYFTCQAHCQPVQLRRGAQDLFHLRQRTLTVFGQ